MPPRLFQQAATTGQAARLYWCMANRASHARSPLWRKIARLLTGLFFILAGLNHFREPALYVTIIPPHFPDPSLLVVISGVAEIVGGAGLLVPILRRTAALGLIALLIAVFPANIYMALYPHVLGSFHIPAWLLWLRLPFQVILIAWIWWIALVRQNKKARPAKGFMPRLGPAADATGGTRL